MRRWITFFLTRHPVLYRFTLRAFFSRNVEKIAFLRQINDGDTVLDIGANCGDFTTLFSDIVGVNGVVHAFEPVSPTFSGLRDRIARENRYPNVVLNKVALGDETGRSEIYVPSGDFGQASLKRHESGSWLAADVDTFDCEIRLLDDYVVEKEFSRLDFIKLDVEGAELLVLRGARSTLLRFHPVIHLEYFRAWAEAFGYGGEELILFLKSLGYNYFYRDDTLTPLKSPVQEIASWRDSQNITCSTTALWSK